MASPNVTAQPHNNRGWARCHLGGPRPYLWPWSILGHAVPRCFAGLRVGHPIPSHLIASHRVPLHQASPHHAPGGTPTSSASPALLRLPDTREPPSARGCAHPPLPSAEPRGCEQRPHPHPRGSAFQRRSLKVKRRRWGEPRSAPRPPPPPAPLTLPRRCPARGSDDGGSPRPRRLHAAPRDFAIGLLRFVRRSFAASSGSAGEVPSPGREEGGRDLRRPPPGLRVPLGSGEAPPGTAPSPPRAEPPGCGGPRR